MNKTNKLIQNKNAIIYARVSTDEQKETGFSLQEQKGRLELYCLKEGIENSYYFEEHHSAKNFKRPEFQAILEKLKSKEIKASVLVVTKIDRFSRDAMETFNMVKSLLDYGVTVYSLSEGLLDFKDTAKFFPLLIQAGAAQHENLLRSDNVIRGMRQALKEGRWMWNAPAGYRNNKETKTIEIEKDNALYVIEAFNKIATGAYSADEVRKDLIQKGFRKMSKQTFLNLLRNPLYCGLIKINAHKEENEEIVKGIHEPIISEELFTKVQDVFNKKRKNFPSQITLNENLPLRGQLICNECGSKLTGSGSMSRNKSKHYYYHCQHGCKERFRADLANNTFEEYLKTFEIPTEILDLYKEILEDVFKQDDVNDNTRKLKFEADLLVLEKRKNSISLKFADDLISSNDYNEMKVKFNNDEIEIKNTIQELTTKKTSFKKYIEFGLPFLFNLKEHYKNADVKVKGKIVGSIFPEKLVFSGNKYRTTKTNELLEVLTSNINGLGDIKKRKADISVGLSSMALPPGLEPGTP